MYKFQDTFEPLSLLSFVWFFPQLRLNADPKCLKWSLNLDCVLALLYGRLGNQCPHSRSHSYCHTAVPILRFWYLIRWQPWHLFNISIGQLFSGIWVLVFLWTQIKFIAQLRIDTLKFARAKAFRFRKRRLSGDIITSSDLDQVELRWVCARLTLTRPKIVICLAAVSFGKSLIL